MNAFLLLFLSMLKIGCFAFGGGYAIIALLENEFISKRQWIDHDEFLDVVCVLATVAVVQEVYLAKKGQRSYRQV